MFFSNDLGVKGMEQHSSFLYYSSVNLQILLLLSMQQSGFIIYIYNKYIFINIFIIYFYKYFYKYKYK